MSGLRMRPVILIAGLFVAFLAVTLQGVQGNVLETVPSEAQCRPYIERALKHLEEESDDHTNSEGTTDTSNGDGETEVAVESEEQVDESGNREKRELVDDGSKEETKEKESEEVQDPIISTEASSAEAQLTPEKTSEEEHENSVEGSEKGDQAADSGEISNQSGENTVTGEHSSEEKQDKETEEEKSSEKTDDNDSGTKESSEHSKDESKETQKSGEEASSGTDTKDETKEDGNKSVEEETVVKTIESAEESTNKDSIENASKESKEDEKGGESDDIKDQTGEESSEGGAEDESTPEEDLIMEIEIPEVLRPRDHINQILKLDEEHEEREKAVDKVADIILRDLKRLYENAIKPLETLYKYRDLSNRHFGDPEIFSKPLILFMGPWSGGKSSIINYLLDIEYKPLSLRTGAEPSPAYFNILMHGEEEGVLDGTQLAADWTFSGLQKFGQGLLDRLKGYRFNSKLLEKVNIVEIPGILEIRKQVQRLFPFNDACQWFIDRADIIFLVYDPAKLDVGPETEAILDQLKGREHQTRIILNKADQVKPEELMRVQGALIWNISPLMSSAEPPIMYSTSLWSIPYEAGAPTRLLYAQERAFLRDLRTAIDKRVEHKIASARRFAVRVRNHAKMVDCYLTTYYNNKGFFAKRKEVSDKIIESPQDYHIYEGLSTLTNISRYDLPDPDVYRDFFRLNPLYEFPLLSTTCTYFRGCPINRLDIAIAYDLPELVGKYKKSIEEIIHQEEAAAAIAEAAAAVEAAKAAAEADKAAATKTQSYKPTRSAASRISMS